MAGNGPSKLYYSISEVSTMTGVKAHVLRYWESEFPTLKPRKTRSGSRRYRQKDIEEIESIKTLLYEKGFRIAGARKILKQDHAKPSATAESQLSLAFEHMDTSQQLKIVRKELKDIKTLIQQLRPTSS